MKKKSKKQTKITRGKTIKREKIKKGSLSFWVKFHADRETW